MSSRVLTGFNKLIDKYPTWVVYIRADKRFKCTCYSELSREGKGLCDKCFGTGRRISFERVPTHLIKPRMGRTPDTTQPVGEISSYDTRIFFKRETCPSEGDLVLEVAWNVSEDNVKFNGQPTDIIHVYRVEEVVAMREGEISFFVTGCMMADATKQFIESQLLSRGI